MVSPQSEDDLLIRALGMNWEHARHVENQRLQVLAVNVALGIALGYVAIYAGNLTLRVLASFLGFSSTLLFWGVTHKLNAAFSIQVLHAYRCARALAIQDNRSRDGFVGLDRYLGFPRKKRVAFIGVINVRTMFQLFYGVLTLSWLFLLGHTVLRLVVVETAL
jgi:hypothetical protein